MNPVDRGGELELFKGSAELSLQSSRSGERRAKRQNPLVKEVNGCSHTGRRSIRLSNSNSVLRVEPEPLLFTQQKPTALMGARPTAYAESLLVPSIMTQILVSAPHFFPPLCPTSNIFTVHSHTSPGGIFQGKCFSAHERGFPTFVSNPETLA